MDVEAVPTPLRAKLGSEATIGLLTVFDRWFAFTWVPNSKDDDDEEMEIDVPEDWPTAPLSVTWLASGRTPASAFDRAFIVTAAASPYSVFLVEGVRSGWFLEVRDLLSGHRFRVVDPEISQHARCEDILLSALITLDGVSTFLGPAGYTLPSDWRTEALDIRRAYSEGEWMSRAELMDMDWDLFEGYREAYDGGLLPYIDSDQDERDPMVLRWRLSGPLVIVLEGLRPLSACRNQDAIDVEYWPDGAPHLLVSWFEHNPAGQKDWPLMRGFLHVDEGFMVGDVPTQTLANRLIAEVAARLGPAATLVETRSAISTRVHARECVLPVPAEWSPPGPHASGP